MFWCWCLLIISAFCKTAESALEQETQDQLELLEEQIYYPINVHLTKFTNKLENLITDISNYELEIEQVIVTYSESIINDVTLILEIFRDSQVDIDCQIKAEEKFKKVLEKSRKDVKDGVVNGITRAQQIISEAKSVFVAIQNNTDAIKTEMKKCEEGVYVDYCLYDVYSKIILTQKILPKIITVTEKEHDTQLQLLEDKIYADFENIAIGVYDRYVEIVNEMNFCVLQLEISLRVDDS